MSTEYVWKEKRREEKNAQWLFCCVFLDSLNQNTVVAMASVEQIIHCHNVIVSIIQNNMKL